MPWMWWFSGIGLFILTSGAIVCLLGVVLADRATELTGFIVMVVGSIGTLYDAKIRKSWPWKKKAV